MTTDRYTKGVLTVIAAALLYLCAMISGAPLSAQSSPLTFNRHLADQRPQPVVVVGWGTLGIDGSIQRATNKERGGAERTDPTVPVAVREMPAGALAVSLGVSPQNPLPVGLTAIAPGPAWEPIRTKVEPAPTLSKPGGSGGR